MLSVVFFFLLLYIYVYIYVYACFSTAIAPLERRETITEAQDRQTANGRKGSIYRRGVKYKMKSLTAVSRLWFHGIVVLLKSAGREHG